MKNLLKIVAVVFVFGIVLSSCSNRAERKYVVEDLEETVTESTYFGEDMAMLKHITSTMKDQNTKNSLKQWITTHQSRHQKFVTDLSEETDRVSEVGDGIEWTVVFTIFITLLLVFAVLGILYTVDIIKIQRRPAPTP